MQSSRMRTTRLLTVSQHALGGGYLPWGFDDRGSAPGVSTQEGVCLPSREGVSTHEGGVSEGGLPRDLSAPEVSAQGVSKRVTYNKNRTYNHWSNTLMGCLLSLT